VLQSDIVPSTFPLQLPPFVRSRNLVSFVETLSLGFLSSENNFRNPTERSAVSADRQYHYNLSCANQSMVSIDPDNSLDLSNIPRAIEGLE
jgi:hypothetical protein